MPGSHRILVALATAILIVAISASAVLAANGIGAALQMGVQNTVNAMTQLIATTANAALKVENKGTGPGITITVGNGESPITVSAGAGKALGLNADKLDGKDATAFQNKITNIGQLVGTSCSDDGLSKVFLNGPRGLLDCAGPDIEPNNTLGAAQGFNYPNSCGFAGGNDVDFWSLPDGCGPTSCDVNVQLYGAGVTMDFYIDQVKYYSDVTSINISDGNHNQGNPGVYQVRVHGSKKAPYGIAPR